MLISREIWLSLLLWNSSDRGYLLQYNEEVFFTCIVEITSSKFWVLPISKEQEEKYNIIREMKDNGYTFLEISDFLNSSEYTPQRTNKFTPQQVFGLLDKMNKRIDRLNTITTPKIYNIGLIS